MSIESDVVSTAVKTAAAPFLHYIYGAIIALLIGGFVVYTVHERHVGAAKIEAADKAHAAIIAKKDQIIADNAQLQLIDVGNHAKLLLAAPPIANAGLVCVAPRQPTPSAVAKGDGEPRQVEQLSTGSFDPSGAILTLLRSDDTRINSLIDTITTLQNYVEELKAANDGK